MFVFFVEYGCNIFYGVEGCIWEEIIVFYFDKMIGVISGGIVYMYY